MCRFLVSVVLAVVVTKMCWPTIAYAQQEETASNGKTEKTSGSGIGKVILDSDVFILDAQIVALVELSTNDPERAKPIYENLLKLSDNFNVAEQFLMHVIRANLDDKPGQEALVIESLEKALALNESITQAQLNTPAFNSAHLKLSEVYVRIGDYKKAYEHKDTYTWNYFGNYHKSRENRIKDLNDKYSTDIKFKENELLQNQSEMRALRIKEIENEKQTQQRNMVVLLVTAVVFVLLLVRQISVRSKLKHLAKTDSLTGLFNRRTLFEKGDELTSQCLSNGSQISALLMDIDHFKQINDEYGHDAGDKIIMAIANLGNEAMRSRDILSRLGGEEFAAILPDSSLEEAKAIAERLREKVESFILDYNNIKLNVTISVGVANIRQVSTEFDSMLNAADEAMYEAKASGRNKVCCYKLQTQA